MKRRKERDGREMILNIRGRGRWNIEDLKDRGGKWMEKMDDLEDKGLGGGRGRWKRDD